MTEKKAKTTTPAPTSSEQRDALLRSEKTANAQHPRNFKEDALSDKIVSVEPDGTGPTSTKTFDPKTDRNKGSGNAKP